MPISHHNELSQSFKKYGDFATRLPRRLQRPGQERGAKRHFAIQEPRRSYIWSGRRRSNQSAVTIFWREKCGAFSKGGCAPRRKDLRPSVIDARNWSTVWRVTRPRCLAQRGPLCVDLPLHAVRLFSGTTEP